MQIINRLIFIPAFLLITFSSTNTWAQFNIAVDYSLFRYDSTQAYTEIYYSIPTSGLTYVETDAGANQAQVMVQIKITRDESLWKEDRWRMEKSVTDTSEIQMGDRMVDLVRYVMEPGRYHLTFYVEDLNDSLNNNSVEKDLEVDVFNGSELSLSKLQFARTLKRASQPDGSLFVKNGFEVIPNPSAVYGQRFPMVYYYAEAYDLPKTIADENYKTRCQVIDSDGELVDKINSRVQVKNVLASTVEVVAVNVSPLPSGIYDLRLEILNTQDGVLESVSKKFYVYNPEIDRQDNPALADISAEVQRSAFALMSGKQLDTEFAQAGYLAAGEEKNAYETLDNDEAKKYFLYRFWQRRDPTPGTVSNEYRQQYLERVKFANENFRSFARKGWKTDRGRVFLVYGSPSDLERFPNNSLSYNYEIWHYDQIEGGVIFVFADLREFGEYTQLHSTKRGETINRDWERVIQKNVR